MTNKSVALDKDQQENISKNLNYLVESQHHSANQIAEKLGLPLVTIRRLMLGNTTDPRISTLKSIAEYFDVSLDLLVGTDLREGCPKQPSVRPYFVPVLSWKDCSKITTIEEIDLKNWKNWLPVSLDTTQKLSDHAFAMESLPSMIPRFSIGTLFVFDPELPIRDSDLALVKFLETNEITLREIIIDPPSWKLLPIVPTSDAIIFDKSKHKIIGIVLLTLLYNRKDK